MIDLIIGLILGIGYLWGVRFIAGVLAADLGYNLDGAGKFMCVFGGMFFGLAWPFIAIGRISYVLWHKFGPENLDLIEALFPEPKEIESRRERRNRLLNEREADLSKRERWVKEREKQLR